MKSIKNIRIIPGTGCGLGWPLALALSLMIFIRPAWADETAATDASADSSMALSGGQEGTVFKSLTIEGENRVKITFDRPELSIDLDPSQAPGLTWGSSMDVLNRTVPDRFQRRLQYTKCRPP